MTPASHFTVRPLGLGELEELLALYAHLHRADAALPDRAAVQATWTELMSNPRYRYFGGYVDHELVASCALSVIPNLTRGCRPYGVIENVVTHASQRRRGLGKAVLLAALEHAWSQGCYKVMLLTGRKDEETRRFYESAGFSADAKQGFLASPP